MDRASSAAITHSQRLPDRAVSASLGIGFLTSFLSADPPGSGILAGCCQLGLLGQASHD